MRNPKNTIFALIFAVITLSIALIAAIVLPLLFKEKKEPPPEEAPALLVDGELVMRYAADYNVSIEYLMLVLEDYLVYRVGGEYVFEPIDYSLPQHSYDWQNLSADENRKYYLDENFPDVKYGIDVSTFQGDIDWTAVAADGIDFAMIRIGYRGYGSGAAHLDDKAEQNIAGAAAAGVDVGAYFFSQAITVSEAEAEAEMLLEAISGYDISYPIVFDMEEISGDIARADSLSVEERTNVAKAFCEKIKNAGYTPMVYGNVKWLAGRLDLWELKEYTIWLAQYHDRPLFPYDFHMWQYTDSGVVNGIEGPVDMNIAFKPHDADSAE